MIKKNCVFRVARILCLVMAGTVLFSGCAVLRGEGSAEGAEGEKQFVSLTVEDIVVENFQTVKGESGGIEISLSLLEGWDSVTEHPEDRQGSFSVRFFPEGDKENGILVSYCADGFGVCGTGLTQQRSTLGEYDVCVGIYDGESVWDFIVIENIPAEGKFVILRDGACPWWETRREEALWILNSLKITIDSET